MSQMSKFSSELTSIVDEISKGETSVNTSHMISVDPSHMTSFDSSHMTSVDTSHIISVDTCQMISVDTCHTTSIDKGHTTSVDTSQGTPVNASLAVSVINSPSRSTSVNISQMAMTSKDVNNAASGDVLNMEEGELTPAVIFLPGAKTQEITPVELVPGNPSSSKSASDIPSANKREESGGFPARIVDKKASNSTKRNDLIRWGDAGDDQVETGFSLVNIQSQPKVLGSTTPQPTTLQPTALTSTTLTPITDRSTTLISTTLKQTTFTSTTPTSTTLEESTSTTARPNSKETISLSPTIVSPTSKLTVLVSTPTSTLVSAPAPSQNQKTNKKSKSKSKSQKKTQKGGKTSINDKSDHQNPSEVDDPMKDIPKMATTTATSMTSMTTIRTAQFSNNNNANSADNNSMSQGLMKVNHGGEVNNTSATNSAGNLAKKEANGSKFRRKSSVSFGTVTKLEIRVSDSSPSSTFKDVFSGLKRTQQQPQQKQIPFQNGIQPQGLNPQSARQKNNSYNNHRSITIRTPGSLPPLPPSSVPLVGVLKPSSSSYFPLSSSSPSFVSPASLKSEDEKKPFLSSTASDLELLITPGREKASGCNTPDEAVEGNSRAVRGERRSESDGSGCGGGSSSGFGGEDQMGIGPEIRVDDVVIVPSSLPLTPMGEGGGGGVPDEMTPFLPGLGLSGSGSHYDLSLSATTKLKVIYLFLPRFVNCAAEVSKGWSDKIVMTNQQFSVIFVHIIQLSLKSTKIAHQL